MTQQNMIEEIRAVYPDAGETFIRLLLNRAMDTFVEKTKLLSSYGTLDIVADQRYYDFSDLSNITSSDDVISVHRVDHDDAPMDRIMGTVKDSDPNEG